MKLIKVLLQFFIIQWGSYQAYIKVYKLFENKGYFFEVEKVENLPCQSTWVIHYDFSITKFYPSLQPYWYYFVLFGIILILFNYFWWLKSKPKK